MHDRFVSEDPVLILYSCDKCKTQGMCSETADEFLAA